MAHATSPCFTERDYECLTEAIHQLGERERRILVLRYWDCLTIQEIASDLRMSWDGVDRTLETVLGKLRARCLEQPEFTRSKMGRLAA